MVVKEGAFFYLRGHLFPPSVTDDHDLRPLVATGLESLALHAPGRHRGLRRGGAAFAAAMRVVDRVHRHAAHRRPHAAPAHAAGLADRFQVVLGVAGLADGGAAVDVHLADLPRAQAQLRVQAFAREHLHAGPGRARKLRALAWQHFHAMHDRADGNVAQRQRVARLDRRIRAGHELRARLHALRRDDIAALAVGVEQEREVRAAVRVVLQALHFGRNRVLVAAPVDDAQVVLVAAALMAGRDAAVRVAPAAPDLRARKRPVRITLVQLGGDDLHEGPATGRGGLDLEERHGGSWLLRGREVDFLALGEPHVGLLPALLAADGAAEAALLALDVRDGDALDLGLEHELDRRLDLRLGGVVGDAEHVLAVPVRDKSALLRHHRREHHVHEAVDREAPRGRCGALRCLFRLLFLGRLPGFAHRFGIHFRISSSFATAPLVSTTFGKRTRATGLALRTDMTSTLRRLRADSIRFSSMASSVVMTSSSSNPSDFTFCARSLVFGASTLNSSTTRSRSSRASCDRIAAIPARYILRFTFWLKFSSGEFGKILPPPRHSGLEVMPARARPVPFCRHGFLVEWFTAPRSFCARDPMRALAWKAITSWCTSASLKSRAKTWSVAWTVPAAPLLPIILSSIASTLRRRRAFAWLRRRLRRGDGAVCRLRRGPGRALSRGLGRLRLDRRSLAFYGQAHHHVAAVRTRHRALDEE